MVKSIQDDISSNNKTQVEAKPDTQVKSQLPQSSNQQSGV